MTTTLTAPSATFSANCARRWPRRKHVVLCLDGASLDHYKILRFIDAHTVVVKPIPCDLRGWY